MSAADRYDPDAITVAESWRVSYKSDELLNTKAASKDKESAAECCDSNASVAAVESHVVPREHAEPPTGADSPGYMRTAIMRAHILPSEKLIVFASILALATWHSLDNFLRVLYQVSNLSRSNICT
jgi:SIT family siderophore-iron:H+ symporter-like MFS transporter